MNGSFVGWCAAVAGWLAVALLGTTGQGADADVAARYATKPQLPVTIELVDTGGTETLRNVRIEVASLVDLSSVQIFVAVSGPTGVDRRTVLFEGALTKGVQRRIEATVNRALAETVVGGVTLAFPGMPPLTQLASPRRTPVSSKAIPASPAKRTADGEPVVEHVIR
jgi:hypothetical protein